MSEVEPARLRCAALLASGLNAGERCSQWAREGEATCTVHRNASGSTVEKARALLEQEAVASAARLLEIAESGTLEDGVRLRAVQLHLDRVLPAVQVHEHRVRVDPQVVFDSLERLVVERRRLAGVLDLPSEEVEGG